jgi:hypothetical protein
MASVHKIPTVVAMVSSVEEASSLLPAFRVTRS